MKLNIIPTPQQIILDENINHSINIEDVKFVIKNYENVNLQKSVNLLKRDLKKEFENSLSNNKIEINFILFDNFPEKYKIPEKAFAEAYTLKIENKEITISAKTPKGIFFGVQSLIQLLENHKSIPLCKIIDFPDMQIRGISDDISRGQVSTLDNFKKIISFISKYKMNTYMPYLEDMIKFDSYPAIGKNRGALTKVEIEELVKFADNYFIEVIPIFQTLGHFENILSLPEFINYADFPGAASLDVTEEKTYTFLETMLKEIFEIFPSKNFHIGADESYDVGLGKSKALLENSDLATIHANHYKRIYDICKKYKKNVMMYGDILLKHPEILEQLPKDITIVDWHYFPRFKYPSTKIFDEAGFKYISSPTVWNFNSTFPENFLAIPNIKTFSQDGIENNSIGMINSSWGDYGAESFRELNYYGYAWSAQCSWNIDKSNSEIFTDNFFYNFYGTTDKSIQKIYNTLSSPTNQVLWNELWRHPLLPHRKQDWRSQKFFMPSKLYAMHLENLDTEFELAHSLIRKNKNHLELVNFAWQIRNYFLLKIKTQELLHKKLEDENVNENNLKNLVAENIALLSELKNKFKQYWLQYNKDANLWMVEDKFSRLIHAFEEIKIQLENGKLENPQIKSNCIHYPSEKDSIVTKAQFKTSFNISSTIESAYLQFLADGHAKLFINNNFVDEVYVKRSGSLWLEQQRVKFIDVKDFLKAGENEIRLEANCFKNRNACINVIAEIITPKDTIKILTDENWFTNNYQDDSWKNANIEEIKRLDIIGPNFKKLRKSWIER